MSKHVTRTFLSALKQQAKARSKESNSPYNATLEAVVREHGYDSLHALNKLLKAQDRDAAGEAEAPFELLLDPILPDDFDNTPNEERSEEEIRQWWMKPFAHKNDDGSYDVRCLSGGAWDRSTWYGRGANLEEAINIAKTKLADWQRFLDQPIFCSHGNGEISMSIDSLHPNLPRTVLATFNTQQGAIEWKSEWEKALVETPKLIQDWVRRARNNIQRTACTNAEYFEQLAVLETLATGGVTKPQKKGWSCPELTPVEERFLNCGDLVAIEDRQHDRGTGETRTWELRLTALGEASLTILSQQLRRTGIKPRKQ